MIKIHYFEKESNTVKHDFPLQELTQRLHAEDLLWVDVYAYNYNELNDIADLFNFHPLAVEDCLHEGSRPKMDQYEGYQFFVFHAPIYHEKSDNEITTIELNIFMGANYIVTVHKQKLPWLGHIENSCLHSTHYLEKGADFLLHTIIDGITDEYFPVLERIRTRIDELEDEIYDYEPKVVTEEFLALKRTIIFIRQAIMPQKRIFSTINGQWKFDIREENIPFYKDLQDHLELIVESTETYRDLVNSALDTYFSIISGKSIEKLNLLTVISTIMLPLSVITSFFGMNVPLPYSDLPMTTIVITVFLVVFTWGMWAYFRKMLA
ncbi:magnesium transporter CorA family protein [Lysinibacillus piscis]|uniref:Magnesium transport protein CorA n=1 Tax=Lysinibacillus piscis TaxID=2518931 RepID=A0ABQ5NK67_9BACI|nr:magnesium transporter CorA family protein [Lysinibacillus sp. KH24]GLC88503.1 magnesium transport protein CorA [Lysinibacillus sp. KH24]